MQSRQRLVLALLFVVLVLGTVGESFAYFATDYLWFGVLGYQDVFKHTFVVELVCATVVGVIAFATVYGNARIALALRPVGVPRVVAEEFAASPLGKMVMSMAPGRVSVVPSALLALAFAVSARAWWSDVLLFLNGGDYGIVDPLLGHDVGFYVFRLPLLQDIHQAASFLLLLTFVSVVGLYAMLGAWAVDMEEIRGQVYFKGVRIEPRVRLHVATVGALWLLVAAAGALLQRYALLSAPGALMAGPGYAMANVGLPLLLVRAALALATALGLAYGLPRRRVLFAVIPGGLYAVVLVGAGVVVDLVQRFQVSPSQLALEKPYLEHHLQATRQAFGLDNIESRPLSGELDLDADDIEANHATIQNIRLWDHLPLLDTFSQMQEIRTFYDFASVDNDRYRVDGQLRQIMLSPREIDVRSLPARSRTWVSETMVYTHGYGVALGPVNEVTEEGLPRLFIQDLPPKTTHPDTFHIEQAAIYYGEAMNEEVLVDTRNPEFDYQQGDKEVYGAYKGQGGLSLANPFTRLLVAIRLQSTNLLLSADIEDQTRVMLNRDIVRRARRIAPFLAYDSDPYLVITDEGRMVWVLDAYTYASRFPYAKTIHGVNTMRNSVKVTVDAYDGDVKFYNVDPADPIVTAWSSAFPAMFRDAATMPKWLVEHLRYPQDWFAIQTELYATYHVQGASVYFSATDEWEVPAVNAERMRPYYTVMRLPGEQDEEFILMLPFNPKEKPNLASWMVARADGEHYGELLAYTFPKDKVVYGPAQISALIAQDADISEKLTLWNQQGSSATRGTMLVIPIAESVVYVQPLYITADKGSLPELKRVIVAYGNQIAMERTLDEALAVVFGHSRGEVAREAQGEGGPDLGDTEPQSVARFADLVREARQRYDAAQGAARAGDWGTYGVELEALERSLRALEAEAR